MQELSAAAKKKLKKKAKDKAKKAGGAAEEPADAEEEQQATPPAAAPKKGGKKVSAAVRRMQEALERQEREAQEASQREAERKAAVRTVSHGLPYPCVILALMFQLSLTSADSALGAGMRKALNSGLGVQEEEAARIAEEEEARMAVEKEQRKAERAARRAEAKRQGLLLTGKAKKEAERLAALREQLLRNSGVDVGGASSREGSLHKRSRFVASASGNKTPRHATYLLQQAGQQLKWVRLQHVLQGMPQRRLLPRRLCMARRSQQRRTVCQGSLQTR